MNETLFPLRIKWQTTIFVNQYTNMIHFKHFLAPWQTLVYFSHTIRSKNNNETHLFQFWRAFLMEKGTPCVCLSVLWFSHWSQRRSSHYSEWLFVKWDPNLTCNYHILTPFYTFFRQIVNKTRVDTCFESHLSQ